MVVHAVDRSTPADPKESDGDADGHRGDGYYDFDDADILAWGRPADARETRDVTRLLSSYYAAAAAANGASACALMDAGFASSVPGAFGHNLQLLRGRTCAAVASKLFRALHSHLRTDDMTLKIGIVRVNGHSGYATLGFEGRRPRSYMTLRRRNERWRVDRIVESDLP